MIKRASALFMTMAFVISACSNSGASTSPAGASVGPASQAPVESAAASAGAGGTGATLVIWADEKRAKAITPLAAQWATENGVTVKVESIATDITTKFKTASQAGNPPDVVVWAHDVIGDFVQNSAIDPIQGLSSYIQV